MIDCLGCIEDIGYLVIYFVLEESGFVIGVDFWIDGGVMVWWCYCMCLD